jgi:hypothetical protein
MNPLNLTQIMLAEEGGTGAGDTLPFDAAKGAG